MLMHVGTAVAKANCYIEEELFVMLTQTGLRSMTNADRKTESEYCSGCCKHMLTAEG